MIKPATLLGRKILIIHFRVGKTDGVSLEIDSWKKILSRMGAEVKLCSGFVNNGADYVIRNLEQQLNPVIYNLDEYAFGETAYFKSEDQFIEKFREIQEHLSSEFEKVILDFKPDNIIVSNIFSVGEHITAAGALIKTLDKYHIPTLAVNHDFYWESSRYKKPINNLVQEELKSYFPPNRDYIKHVCINSIGKQALKERCGINAELLYDTLDFNQPIWNIDKFNVDFFRDFKINPGDIVILQATRIVRRKNIEVAMDFVKELSKPEILQKIEKDGLYDGRSFHVGKNKIVLVLPGYAEKRNEYYLEHLINYSRNLGINVRFIGDRVETIRQNGHEGKIKKLYSLWDIYPFADLVTYPSEYEGFGNQFLEAVFAKKPVVVFEYPVYTTDIKDKGFDIISLGNKVIKNPDGWSKIPKTAMVKAVSKSLKLLTSRDDYISTVEKNFSLGAKYFSYEKTADVLAKLSKID